MKLFKIFGRKSEKKSTGNYDPLVPGFYNYLYARRDYQLAFVQAIRYYDTCSPLNDAIVRIVQEIASIEPEIYDIKKNAFIPNHPAKQLLLNPNAFSTYEEFIEDLVTFYLLTKNCFINADGDISRPPVSLNIIPPQLFTDILGDDGYVAKWSVRSAFINNDYFRRMYKLRYRYYTQDDAHELYQIKGFNGNSEYFKIWGKSTLNPLYYEIEQYILSGIHNLSLLEKGAAVGGIFTATDMISEEGIARLRQEIQNYYSGAVNAGRQLFLEAGINFNPNTQSNKDMDFAALKDRVTTQIYKNLKIPLPLINESTMTMANLDASVLLLYDNAVLPLIRRIFSELTTFLMPRFGNSENLIFWFDDSKISALEPRRLSLLQQKVQTGVLTANEARRDIQLPPFKEGGDELYQPATNIPYATDLQD